MHKKKDSFGYISNKYLSNNYHMENYNKKKISKINLLLIVLVIINIMFFSSILLIRSKKIVVSKPTQSTLVKEEQKKDQKNTEERNIKEGYNLPIDNTKKEEVENDCMNNMMNLNQIVMDLTGLDSKGSYGNEIALSEEQMLHILKEFSTDSRSSYVQGMEIDMENEVPVDKFLNEAKEGKSGCIVVYELHKNAGMSRKEFIFDGQTMYLLATNAVGGDEEHPFYIDTSYTRIINWSYTEKGWFCYELSVPKGNEVTEVVNGDAMFRVKPLKQEYRDIAAKYLMPIKYQGNNLFTTNWDEQHMENIDYTGVYDSVFEIQNHKPLVMETNMADIPEQEFENVLTKALPVTRMQLKDYALYNSEKHTYRWKALGCGNCYPTAFGNSIPEITDIENQTDGTCVLTIDAVCERSGEDAVITHKLTVRFEADGSIRFIKNEIQGNGLSRLPHYYYRLRSEDDKFPK